MNDDRALPIDPATRNAIDAVYQVFSRYALPRAWDAAPGENGKHRLAVLSSAPLRDLTADQLGVYAGSALYTIGDVDDYRHFLPRIIELAALGCEVWVGIDPPTIAVHLQYAEWLTWPDDEQAALLDVFRLVFDSALEQRPDIGLDAEDWLCALAVMGEDIAPHLARWSSATGHNAALQAAWFLGFEPTQLLGPSGDAAYWSYVDAAGWTALGAWAFGEDVPKLLRAALPAAEADDLEMIERALAALSA